MGSGIVSNGGAEGCKCWLTYRIFSALAVLFVGPQTMDGLGCKAALLEVRVGGRIIAINGYFV